MQISGEKNSSILIRTLTWESADSADRISRSLVLFFTFWNSATTLTLTLTLTPHLTLTQP